MRLVLASFFLALMLSVQAFAATDTSTITPSNTSTATRTATPTNTPSSTITPSPTPGAIIAYYPGDSSCQLCNYIGSGVLILTMTNGSITNPSSPTPAQGDRSLGTGFAGLNSYFRAPTSVLTSNGSLSFYYYAYPQISQPSTETVIEVKGSSIANNFLITYNYSQRNFRIYYNGNPGSGAVFVDSPSLSVNTNAWNKVFINHNENGVAIKLNSGSFSTNSTAWVIGTVSQIGIGGSASQFPMTSTNIIDAVLFSSQLNEGFPPTLPTGTATVTPSITATRTITVTRTITATSTITPTFTVTPSITQTFTDSPTPSVTPSITVTRTVTQSITPTSTRTSTVTLTATPVFPTGLVRSVNELIAFTGITPPNTYTFTLGRTPAGPVPFTGSYIRDSGSTVFFSPGDFFSISNETDASAMATATNMLVLSYVSSRTIKLRDPGQLSNGVTYILNVSYLSVE